MFDISMCNNHFCKKKDTCYRYMAKSSQFQSYSEFKPDENGKCEYFMVIENIRHCQVCGCIVKVSGTDQEKVTCTNCY